jgi:hypothetical protein
MSPRPPYLGEFEYAILLAVLHLGDEAYAVPLRELIEERTGRPVARGALYTALERLEAKGCLRSRMGDPTPERGGRARRPAQHARRARPVVAGPRGRPGGVMSHKGHRCADGLPEGS